LIDFFVVLRDEVGLAAYDPYGPKDGEWYFHI
jgi:hypothetical protein